MTPEEALAEIDHVVADWTVSDDAMRWRPEPEPEEPSPWGYSVTGGVERFGYVQAEINRRMHEAQRLANIEASWEGWTERNMARGWGSGGRLADESEHDPAGAYERRRQERRGLDIRWDADYPPVVEDEAVPPGRVYISTHDRPFDPASPDWVEIGTTDQSIEFSYPAGDYSAVVPRPFPSGRSPLALWAEAWNRANPPMPNWDVVRPSPDYVRAVRRLAERVGVELTDWQRRIIGEFSRLAEVGPLDHSPAVLHDPDRRDLPLRLVGGVQAQRSPYGQQGRMIPPDHRPRMPLRRAHRRHTRRAS